MNSQNTTPIRRSRLDRESSKKMDSRVEPENDNDESIKNWLKKATKKLLDIGIESARLDCLLLLENEIGKSREWVLSHDDTELSDDQLQNLNKMIAHRIQHEPVAYIIGSKEFYGRNFMVTPDVLIPRPESEAIIDLLLDVIPAQAGIFKDPRVEPEDDRIAPSLNKDHPCSRDDPCIIVDVGTGSGCLAITAKLEFPEAKVIATDISKAALEIARQNAMALGTTIEFSKADLLPTMDYGLWTILANLPYVPEDLITSEEITKEPPSALFSGEDGLNHYRKFWEQIAALEHKPQHIITESLENQHSQMIEFAHKAGYTLADTKTLAQLFTSTPAT